ncbi:MAG: DUF5686 family protein [Bacteroidota bacterium]
MSLLYSNNSRAQIFEISGKVVDSISKIPLPFVNIVVNSSKTGSTSDIDGKFSIKSAEPINYLKLSYVGYFPQVFKVDKSTATIFLTSKNIDLSEITILPGINPALRIIENAIKNKEKNNPQNLSSFSYQSYNKMVFTADLKDLNIDSIKNSKDTVSKRLIEFLETHDIMLIESVSKRLFLNPNFNKEKVIGSRISGFSNPSFTLLASQLQSFSFYSDLIKISDKNYLNPIANGSANKYNFLLQDTIYQGNDTVFIISYQSQKNKNFDALKGLLYINTNGYALQNVIAEPEDPYNGTTMKIQQIYELIDGKYWFPTQQNADLKFNNLMIGKYRMVGIGRTSITDIKVNIPLSKKDFDRLEFQIDNNATGQDSNFWEKNRTDSLTKKNVDTYKLIDSIGKEGKLDQKVKGLEALITGKIPYHFLDLDLAEFISVNKYEGLRLGIDAQTNSKICERISVGGAFAYGFKDKQVKYGSRLSILLNKAHELNCTFAYANDVEECGSLSFYYDNKIPFQQKQQSETYRKLLINRMYKYEKYSFTTDFRIMQYANVSLSLCNRTIQEFKPLKYAFSPEPVRVIKDNYLLTEIGLNFKFAYREKYMENFRSTISLGTKYPVFLGQVIKGFNNLYNGEIEYTKYNAKLIYTFTTKTFGKSFINLQAGYISQAVPYSLLYTIPSSYSSFSVFSANSFATMRMNEFSCDKFVSAHFYQDFGKLLLKTKYFQPDIVFSTSAIIGNATNTRNLVNANFSVPDNTYLESGILFNSLIKSTISGIGLGCFYRYGYYHLPKFKDNFTYTLSITFTL